jgi:hypothetical protein
VYCIVPVISGKRNRAVTAIDDECFRVESGNIDIDFDRVGTSGQVCGPFCKTDEICYAGIYEPLEFINTTSLKKLGNIAVSGRHLDAHRF